MATQADFYKVLEVDSKATQQQIRDAYKKAALKHHPDRVPTTSPERPRRTRKFQQINDAYYTLSDPARRRDYDATRRFSAGTSTFNSNPPGGFGDDDFDEEIPHGNAAGAGAAPNGPFSGFPFSTFASAFGFGGAADASSSSTSGNNPGSRANAPHDRQFESVFEEMMRDEGLASDDETGPARPTGKFWSMIGGVSGGAMGFIVANVPGAMAGALAGNRLGAVRDKRGKAVYSVFQELPQADKAKLLSELAAKVFAHAVSG